MAYGSTTTTYTVQPFSSLSYSVPMKFNYYGVEDAKAMRILGSLYVSTLLGDIRIPFKEISTP